MPLSSDPEKRARSLANLRRGNEPPATAATTTRTAAVARYPEPTRPDSAPRPKAAPAAPASAGTPDAGGGFPWPVVVGGALGLLLLVLLLQFKAPPQ